MAKYNVNYCGDENIMAIVHPLKQYNQMMVIVDGEPKAVQLWNPNTKTGEWPINALPSNVFTSLVASLNEDSALVAALIAEAAVEGTPGG